MRPEDVKAALDARRKPGAVLGRLKSRKGVRGVLKEGVTNAVARDVRGLVEDAFATHEYQRYSFFRERRGALGPTFARLEAADRQRLIRTLLPNLEAEVESAWSLLAHRPYQQGLTRRPFRCPQSAETQADVRGQWLLQTTLLLGDFDADIRWVASWAAHLGGWWGAVDLGWLLAGAIDAGGAGGEEVLEILKASATGEHEVGRMGRHVTQALLSCSRPDAWEFVERLLLSAQRQEGLRQAILESVDEAHPLAFRRMLRLIRDENLARFSSVVRAADTWFGFLWDGASAVKIDDILERVLSFLDEPEAGAAALGADDPETVYLALWSQAFEDVDAAVAAAVPVLASPSAEHRYVATHLLVQALWTSALPQLVDALEDADLRVAARALDAFGFDATKWVDGPRLFGRLEALMGRLPKRSRTLGAAVWPWSSRKLERTQVAAAMAANAEAVGVDRLLPYVGDLEPVSRAALLRRVAGLPGPWEAARSGKGTKGKGAPGEPARLTEPVRAAVLGFLGDPSPDVRATAFRALGDPEVRPDEVDRLIDLLSRKTGDLRSACLARLRRLPDEELLTAADRLLADGAELRRVAGLELLRLATEDGRSTAEARERVERYRADRTALSEQERLHVEAVLDSAGETPVADDALGLVDPASLRSWPEPRNLRLRLDTPAALAGLEALAGLVLEHRTTEIRDASGEARLLVEASPWSFAPKGVGPQSSETLADREQRVPLLDVWKGWVLGADRPRDGDGLEMARALMADADSGMWRSRVVREVAGTERWSAGRRFLGALLEWCIVWDPPAAALHFFLDGLEQSLAALTSRDHEELGAMAEREAATLWVRVDPGDGSPLKARLERIERWLARVRWWRDLFPNAVDPAHAGRLFGLLRGARARSRGYAGFRILLRDYLDAYRAGVVGPDDFVDLLVGRWSGTGYGSPLREVSTRRLPRGLESAPELVEAVERCRRRIVEVETRRGDRPTAASRLALELRRTGGLETLSRALTALGTGPFARTTSWLGADESRRSTLSHLVLRSTPGEPDSPDAFAGWARSARIKDSRLVELAVYAPQWASHVAHVLGWPGLESAAWWVQAHTKDDRSWQLAELKEIWAAEVSERTSLSAADLMDGAVDVDWFREAFDELGPERWQAVDRAAKYAASSAGHTRARLFAGAMTGAVAREELAERIRSKRHQDSVRALGLLPLGEGDDREEDLLERYEILQRFRRESRKFGSQRQASEGRAVAIGLANLARTAGFRNPQRLQWAMEREAVADLARGSVTRTSGDVTVELSIDQEGVPSLVAAKAGKPLKSVPARLAKDPEIAELKGRLRELRSQGSRVRGALEDAMCRSDAFEPVEVRRLLDHPLLGPALRRLVLVGEGIAGYPDGEGHALRDHEGALHAIGTREPLRIAHPHDLFGRGDWSAWQRECFRVERVQPFKQLFREYYPTTDSERGTKRSRRYAGHQVNPRQALALLGGRGWVARPEEGVSRTFHEAGLTARLGFQEAFYTPADIEGLTLEELVFTPKGQWEELSLDTIPPPVFSEAMRDLDLAVAVAHRGGVDPEATASTVEMRAALLRETCGLLGLENVEVQANHAIVRGELGTYSVHLGSAGVLLMPGTSLPIVAVHSQHRGRLFLPFADDDPRTAEVLSKVLLLARDREIRDPTLLQRIRAVAG